MDPACGIDADILPDLLVFRQWSEFAMTSLLFSLFKFTYIHAPAVVGKTNRSSNTDDLRAGSANLFKIVFDRELSASKIDTLITSHAIKISRFDIGQSKTSEFAIG
jgi:hypothetical protein